MGAQIEVDTLDYDHYLPLFLDGLAETQHPYEFLARKGAEELISRSPDRVAPLLPMLTPPLRRTPESIFLIGLFIALRNRHHISNISTFASIPIEGSLNTRNPRVVCASLKILQLIAGCSKEAGRGLLTYYKSLLPVFNLFRVINLNQGDRIDYAQQKGQNLGDLVQETLEVLEKNGGSRAFVHIKNMVPTYESCLYK